MNNEHVLEVTDKSGRTIHLSKRQWTHIRKKHPEIESLEMLRQGIENFDKITTNDFDPSVFYFRKYFKPKKSKNKYLCTVVKYLNGNGYIITAYFDKK
jgi:hypothetical protein